MELHVFDEARYAPDYRDNRDLPEDKRFFVTVVPMTGPEYRQLEESHGKLTRGGNINYVRRYNKLRARAITKCVTGVENLTLTEVKNGQKTSSMITTGKRLAEIAPAEILEDIIDAIKNQSLLADGLVGKSDSQSDTST